MNIFISYAPQEESLARDLASRLEKAGHDVWYLGGRVFPGENLGKKAGAALERSHAMLVLVSPQSMQSPWVRGEIEYAMGSARFAGRVVPIMVKPTKDVPWIFEKFPTVSDVTRPEAVTRRVLQHLNSAGD